MGVDDKDQVKHISSLDFDISKVENTMKNLNSIFESNMKKLESTAKNYTDNINQMFANMAGSGSFRFDFGKGIGSPQNIAKDINKSLANTIAGAVKHLNSFLDKVGEQTMQKEVMGQIKGDLDNTDKQIAKWVYRSINLKTSDIREELQRVPVWARSNKGAKIDDVADELLSQFGSIGVSGNTPTEQLLNWFDSYKAYSTTKKDLVYEIGEMTQSLARAREYAGKSINEITESLTKALETVLDPKELAEFQDMSFEDKREYLLNLLKQYRATIANIEDENIKKFANYIDTLTGESELTVTKSDIVKDAVKNLNHAQENLQKRITRVIGEDIKSITEIYKESKLQTLGITRFFDEDMNVIGTAETTTENRAKMQTVAYKDLHNLLKQMFDLDKQRIGASEEQLKLIEEMQGSIVKQYVEVTKIIGAYGLEDKELQKKLGIEEQRLGNAVRLKEIKAEEAIKAKEEIERQRQLAKLEKERMTAEKQLPKLETQAATLQKTVKTKELSAELSKQAGTLREQVQILRSRLDGEGKLTDEEVKQTQELEKQLGLLQEQVKTARADKDPIPKERESPFMARMQTALSYGAIYKGIQAMKEASNVIKEVEMGLTEIARVSDDPAFNFAKARDSIIQLGIDYGQTFENVQHITLRWVQSGYDVADALELTKTSLLALNTAELDANAATESMIGIMAQWQLETKDLGIVLDKVNKVADSFALTSQDLVDGLLRASGAARVMGLDIDHTIALLTAMREASGRTGREVGNALNSILSYIQRAKSIDVMESMGIRMFADEARTQFRNVFEIFEELSQKWNDPNIAKGAKDALMAGAEEAGLFAEELSNVVGMQDEHIKMLELETKATEEYTDMQKRDAAQAAAGVFRRNYFIGLLERFAVTHKALAVAHDAEGYSMKENIRTMDTLEKKLQSLKTAYVQLAVAIGEAGLLDSLKDMADAGMEMVSAFAKLDSPIKDFIINLGIIAGTIQAAKFMGNLFGLSAAFEAIGSAIPAATMGAVSASMVVVIGLIMTIRTHLRKAEEEKRMLLEGGIEEGKKEIENLESMIARYEELETQAVNNAEAKEELLKIQKELAEIYPEYVDYVDEEGNKLVTNIGLLKEMNILKREELELKRQELLDKVPSEINKLEDKKVLLEKQIKDIDDMLAQGWKTDLFGADLLESRGLTVKKLQEIIGELALYNQFYREQAKNIEDVERARISAIYGLETETGALKDNSEARAENIELTAEQIQAEQEWVKLFNDSISNMEAYNKMLTELNSKEGLSNRSKQDIITKYQQLIPYLSSEKDLREQLLIAIDNEDKAQQKMYLSKIENDETFYKTMISNNETLVEKLNEAYTTDLGNFTSLADAKMKVETLLLGDLISLWHKYYDIQSDSFKNLSGTVMGEKERKEAERVIEAVYKLRQFKDELDSMALKGTSFRSSLDTTKAGGSGSTANTALQEYLRLLEHRKRMDELSIQEEIKGYEYALKHYAKTANEKMDLEEKIFALKKSLTEEEKKLIESVAKVTEETLSDQMKTIKDAYDKRTQMIDDELDLKKKAQQEIIDGIDKEIEAMNEKDKKSSHNRKIADLEEKLEYHQMRTGIEHERAIADIEKQIADENKSYKNDLKRQELEDKKKVAQDEIKDLEENANKQKTVLKKSLDSFEELFEGSNKSIIAAAMAMSKEYAEIVDGMINRAKQAILESDLTNEIEFEGFGEVTRVAEKGQEGQMIKSYVGSIVDYKQMYDIAANAGNKDEMTKAYESAKRYYNLLESSERGKGFAEQLKKMNYEQAKKLLDTATFHSGGKNVKEGLALLKRNEIVLNPRLSEAFERFSISLMRNPTQTSIDNSRNDSKNVTVDKAVNIENAYFEDETDIEIFGREVKRVVGALP